jgi:hypothetical protein
MKHLLLCSIVAAFACVSVQAGEGPAPKAKTATCETACCAKKVTVKADSTAKGASQLIAKR